MQFLRWAKLQAHVVQRHIKDAFSPYRFCKKRIIDDLPFTIELTQPFTYSSTLEQKKKNLNLAASRISKYVILPGEIFSFWRCVGNPNKKSFATSRGIRGGVLQLERGGGLCQASGIIHHLSLIGGLEVVERFNHSKDLYTEETRFCPLGSDATVAYGYRDLRIRNNTDSSLQFELQVHNNHFKAILRSDKYIKRHEITFEYEESKERLLIAKTIDKTENKLIAVSKYEKI